MTVNSSVLGIVVIGRNEGDRLRRCLLSVPPAVPVVYVDSASTDGSVGLASARGAEVVQLDLSRPFTAARARNEGCERLLQLFPDLDYVQFVDGDCEFEDGWLQTAKHFLDCRPSVAVVCGRRRERYPEQSFYNRLCDEEWNTPVGEAEASGGDALVRASVFAAADGYDPDLIAGEEPEFCSRLRRQGWIVWRLDAPMTVHDAAMNLFQQWWRRALRSGYGYAQVWHKTKRCPGRAVFGRELGRAVMWTLGVPVAAIVAALLWETSALLLAPLAWILQLARLSIRYGTVKGTHLLLAKAAEFLGAARYAVAFVLRRDKRAIYYK
jgi:glycosyltransferase involved in cell wall biosynthesis